MIIITPYDAIGPVHFGMNEIEVRGLFGNPEAVTKDKRGNTVLRYEDKIATIAAEGLVEVGFLPDASISVFGINPFSDPEAFEKLCELDGDPKEVLGFIILLNLGLTMTGFHDGDESQKAITVFSRDRWDVLKSEMKSYLLPKRFA